VLWVGVKQSVGVWEQQDGLNHKQAEDLHCSPNIMRLSNEGRRGGRAVQQEWGFGRERETEGGGGVGLGLKRQDKVGG
jgi:hypothetical protein